MKRIAAILTACVMSLPAQQEVPTFKASSNLVIITVFVRDRNGKVVEGLKKSDFEVLENGLPQSIAVFDFEKIEDKTLDKFTATVTAEAAPEARPIERPSFGAEREKYRDRRLLVLYFDWSTMQPDEQVRVLQGAEKYLREEMGTSDLISIMSYNTRLRVDQEFTSDRASLLAVLKKYRKDKAAQTVLVVEDDERMREMLRRIL